MKLLYKFISVVLITAIVYVSCCCASDSGVMQYKEPAYIPPPKVQESSKKIVIKKTPEQPTPTEVVKAEKKKKIEKIEKDSDFTTVFINMLVALGKTIALIIALVGAYLIYKKFKPAKKPAIKKKKPGQEPKTIGEAVASYLKHRLKK